jgi:AraC-like DNA-binding protein
MKEITPLTDADCFMVFSRVKKEFTFPVHIHTEYELNFVENAKGVQRIVGDSVETIGDLDLTLITGAELEHAWVNHQCVSEEIREITFQFHPNLLSESLLSKNAFKSVEKLLKNAKRGVSFSDNIIRKLKPKLELLSGNGQDVRSVLELIYLLYELSLDPDYRILSSSSMSGLTCPIESRRIEKVYAYIEENYSRGDIRLAEAASLTGMTEVAFCRFIKKRTGKSFVDILNDIRLGHAVKLLISTTQNISEICYECGFNNLSNFNRLFLRKKKCTPRTFREHYACNRILI